MGAVFLQMEERRVLVRDIMSKEIIALEPEATIAEAIARMEQHRIHELPVMQNSSLKGWLNYDTLIQRAHSPASTKVSHVMVPSPKLAQTTDLVTACDVMIRQNIRAAPVVDAKGNMVGVISRTDLMRAASELPEIANQVLEKVMTRDLETIAEDASVDEAARRLRETSIRQLIVLDKKGKMVGTVGREVILHALTSEDKGRAPMVDIGGGRQRKDRRIDVRGLVESPVVMTPKANLGAAIKLMLKQRRTSVVVEEEGLPVGVVSRANILERVAARAVPDQPLVQVIGLAQHVDSSILDQIHAYARASLVKVEKSQAIEFLSLHYKVYKAKTEGDSKYSVTGHLSTDRQFLVAKGDDWDPIRATNGVLGELERRIIEAKEIRLERRRAPRKGSADPYRWR